MIRLKRYELNFEEGVLYFKYSLADTNELSSQVLKLVNFNKGRFFTLLSDGVDVGNIHQFKLGGIACGVRDQMNLIILNKLRSEDRLSCIFDNITETFKSGYNEPLFLSCGLTYNSEIYYLITKKTASENLIEECFCASNAIWHSLCILTKVHINGTIKKNLSYFDIENICSQTRLIIIGAYDGEGYIFWENEDDVNLFL